jgi:hypothetical protein
VGLLTRRKIVPAGGELGPGTRPANALVGAAVPINLSEASSWQFFKLGDHRWQLEAWKHYDICGEMRFVVNWVGQAISRCRLYAATIGPDGIVGGEASDERIRTIAETMFGTPAGKAQAQKMLGINMMTAGDVFVVAEGYQNAKEDKWYVCSSSEVYRRGDDIMVKRSMTHGGGQYRLDPTKDLLIRAWNPHPRRYDAADSTVRAILPVLRELEQLTKRVFAELDSRLAGAGILLLPDNITFPAQPGDVPGETRSTGIDDFATLLTNTMATSMQQRDSAAAIVPIVLQVAVDALDKIKHLTFDSSISDKITEMREAAIRRMAMSLDIPPEVLTGMGAANHWSGWQIEESSIKIHIEPLLIQLADALNIGYFQPALKAAGIADPEKYTLWFDVGPLTVRPNRSEQANTLGERGLLSDEAVREANAFTEDDAPTKDAILYNLMKQLVLAQPQFASDPAFQKVLGLPEIANPNAAPPDPNMLMPGDPGYDEAGTEPADAGEKNLPMFPSVADAEAGKAGGGKLKALAAAANALDGTALFYASDSAVRRALELAGGRLVPGPARARYGVPKHLLHTRVAPDIDRVPSLMAGAWTHVREQATALGVNADALETTLAGYTTVLLTRGLAHEADWLRAALDGAKADLAS